MELINQKGGREKWAQAGYTDKMQIWNRYVPMSAAKNQPMAFD